MAYRDDGQIFIARTRPKYLRKKRRLQIVTARRISYSTGLWHAASKRVFMTYIRPVSRFLLSRVVVLEEGSASSRELKSGARLDRLWRGRGGRRPFVERALMLRSVRTSCCMAETFLEARLGDSTRTSFKQC